MATDKREIKFYAHSEVADWFETLPPGKGSATINEILLAAISDTAAITNTATPIQTTSEIISPPLTEDDVAKIEKRLTALEQEQTQHDYQLYELNDWKGSMGDPDLFNDLETEDIKTSLEFLQDLTPKQMKEAVAAIPVLLAKVEDLQAQINILTNASKKTSK